MPREKGPWRIEDSIQRFKSEWLEVCEDKVIRPDGQYGSYATVRIRPGVSVLAVDDDDGVYLTREYRYAIEEESVEVVSGAIEDGELPETSARRELREELGIVAERWTDLGAIHPLTSMLHSPANLFMAQELNFFEPDPQDAELIQMVRVGLHEAVQMVMDSKIKHAPSCVLILKANHLLHINKGSS